MVIYDSENKIFYLNTTKTTYAIGVFKNEALIHLYWGKKINKTLNSGLMNKYIKKSFAAADIDDYSSDSLPLEFSTYGVGDTRLPSLGTVNSDGSRVTKFSFEKYEIINGKPGLKGLPATYCEDNDNVETLNITLRDKLKNIEIILSYSVFEDFDVITRSMKIINNGERFELNTALSTIVDFYGLPESDLIHLDGTWARERNITRNKIAPGNQNVASRYGASSAIHNPFIAICDKNTTENYGNIYGFSLVYSGCFTAGAELNEYNCARAYIGINPFNFDFVLDRGDSFQTPEAVLVFSPHGIGGMSRIYHNLYRQRLCRGKFRDKDRFVLINNWEATYFNFTEEKIVEIAKKAAEIGIDTMVLDDGWFGARNNDDAGLGDWYENPDKLPNGLPSLVEKINSLGMRFGLWFEPEMVNPDSNLYRNHPDWILHCQGREPTLTRNQLILDLSRKDVCDYIIDSVSAILEKANIEYVKWDMNRYMTLAGSALLPPEKQGEVMHRYMLGLYYVLEAITGRFPNVLFESCASGGGRFDPGMLYYMPQVWTSDDSDAVERLEIQYGTSIVYPFSSMGAHVSACPNHQINRTTPFNMRCNVAMQGQFGFELDLNKCTPDELKTAEQSIIRYKELQHIMHYGECYRIKSPFETNLSVIEFLSEDKNTVVLCINSKKATANSVDEYLRLDGLDENAVYSLESGEAYGGDYLMNQGILFINRNEYESLILKFQKN